MSTSSTRSAVIAATIIFSTAGQSAGAPCGINVEFPRVTDEQIFSQFEGAILRIQSEGVGTGFLIDAKQGFVLTAGHVVRDAIDKPGTRISARSPALPKQELKLLLIKDLTQSDQIDLALLQLDPPDTLSQVIPIDVSFRPPRTGATAYAMGYSRGESDPSKQSVSITKITEKDGIVVKASSYPGDSGSPLISDRGIAIGITRARIDAAIAHYTPMADALELLRVIPITLNMSTIDGRVRSKSIAQDDLKAELQPVRTSTSLRNVDLVSWSSQIIGSRSRYSDVRGMFDCPIVPAFWHRTLDEAANLLTPIMTTALKSQTKLRIAQNATALGRNSLAEREIASALADYIEASSYGEEIGLDPKFARAVTGKAAVTRGDYDRSPIRFRADQSGPCVCQEKRSRSGHCRL
jgi:S1-C subfamily serine protease